MATGGSNGTARSRLWHSRFEHDGVQFPPPYQPHGFGVLCEGHPVQLSPEAEEIATIYATMQMRGDPHLGLPTFRKNFGRDWAALVAAAAAKPAALEAWDFSPIIKHLVRVKKKKDEVMDKERAAAPPPPNARDVCPVARVVVIDGRVYAASKTVVDRPGIFIARRPDHPLMGRIRRRVTAADVVLNLSKGAPVPVPPPSAGSSSWGRIVHDPYANWLAAWRDPLTGNVKYAYMDATATVKQQQEHDKFEAARAYLRAAPGHVRPRIARDVRSSDARTAQLATCVAVIDAFGIRAGGDRAQAGDTQIFGATTLQVRHVVAAQQQQQQSTLRLRFVGKDGVPFEAERPVGADVASNVAEYTRGRRPGDPLFGLISREDVNAYLDGCLRGLTCKVLRTCFAGTGLDQRLRGVPLLLMMTKKAPVPVVAGGGTGAGPEKKKKSSVAAMSPQKIAKALFDIAFFEVALRCNHRRVNFHDPRLTRSATGAYDWGTAWEASLRLSQAVEALWAAGEKKKLTPASVRQTLATCKELASTLRLSVQTSKVNYIDPRIVVAYCKRTGLPLQRVYTRAQLGRFWWAADAPATFVF